jgi:anti-sigma B factor antagonist
MNWYLSVKDNANGTVIRFVQRSVRLDGANAEAMAEYLSSFWDGREPIHLVFDLGQVEFITSEALGVLVTLHKRVAASGGCLTLLNLREEVYEVFEVTKLTRILRVHREEGYGYLTNQGAVASSDSNPGCQ